jgi:hypothetical protein
MGNISSMKSRRSLTTVLVITLGLASLPILVQGQDQSGNLCGPEPKERIPLWILRFEVLDRDSHAPISNADVTIVDSRRKNELKVLTDQRGVGVFVISDPNCLPPDRGSIEIVHRHYHYRHIEIDREQLRLEEDDKRILLEGHMHNWTGLDANPDGDELIYKVKARQYRVGVKNVSTEFGFAMPNYAPALFEYRIEMQHLSDSVRTEPLPRSQHDPRINSFPDVTRPVPISEGTIQWAQWDLSGLQWGMSIEQVRQTLRRKVTVVSEFEGKTQAEIRGLVRWIGKEMEFPTGGCLTFKLGRLGEVLIQTIRQRYDPNLLRDLGRVFGPSTVVPHPNYPPNGKFIIWQDDSTYIEGTDFHGEGPGPLLSITSKSINPWDKEFLGVSQRTERTLNIQESTRSESRRESAALQIQTTSGAVESNGRNVAKNASVTVDATGGSYRGVQPSARGVVDGDANSIGGFWSGRSGSSTGWIQLTLDKEYLISRIRVYSMYWDPAEYGREGYLEYRVDISNDGNNWKTVLPKAWAKNNLSSMGSWAKEDISFTQCIVRYVKVTITNSSGPSSHLWRTLIREIEIGDANLPLHNWER